VHAVALPAVMEVPGRLAASLRIVGVNQGTHGGASGDVPLQVGLPQDRFFPAAVYRASVPEGADACKRAE